MDDPPDDIEQNGQPPKRIAPGGLDVGSGVNLWSRFTELLWKMAPPD